MWIYLNNRFVSEEEAKISVFDHGFLYGDGVFETLRSYGGKVFMLSEHIARLEQSAARLHIPMPVKRSRLSAIVAESLELNKLTDAYLRITVSRGLGDRKSTRLNSSHGYISYAVFCLKKKKIKYSRLLDH